MVSEHPRSRGENGNHHSINTASLGTSPLTRGKREIVSNDSVILRNIPAHAGKTEKYDLIMVSNEEHPRSRGENQGAGHAYGCCQGTSPLTRGKPKNNRTHKKVIRNIPAHAGKTLGWGRGIKITSEHPRSRGENATCPCCAVYHTGTSPLTRGKHYPQDLSRVKLRNIPAHAGKTLTAAPTGWLA